MAVMAGSVARRYARALFDIGVDKGSFEKLGTEMEAVAALYESSRELQNALDNPVFKAADKEAIMKRLLPSVAQDPLVHRFVLLLLGRRRIRVLPLAARVYREMVDEHLGRVRATISSAKPLQGTELDSIRRALERRMGKKVLVEASVDPELIGGVVARVGDLVVDGSVRTQLDTIRNRLVN